MRLRTILDRVEEFKSFGHGEAHFEEQAGGPALVVRVPPRKDSLPDCSGRLRRGRIDDHLEERRSEFVPLRGILVSLAYPMRRGDRPRRGVTVEMVPWGDGENRPTTPCRRFPASRARRLSGGEVGSIFRTSRDRVRRAAEHAVEWGPAHRDLSGVTAVGIDEVAWQRGPTSMTRLYDIGARSRRPLAVAEHRTEASLRSCPDGLGEGSCPRVKFVRSEMWQPSPKVIAERMGGAIHVRDRSHIMKRFGKALDEIRAEEAERLERDGDEPVLTRSRWCPLKRPEDLTGKRTVELAELLEGNLRTVRAYLLREDFRRPREYSRPSWAGKFLDEWTRRVMRSRLEPMKEVARTLRDHQPPMRNWSRAKGEVSSGAVEGLNDEVKWVTRKS